MKNPELKTNKFRVSAPSNIAFVKYWGKEGRQLPLNPSVSMTLSHCKTMTSFEYSTKAAAFNLDQTLFEGKFEKAFHTRLHKYFLSLYDLCPELSQLDLSIASENTFPHSAGIASSASAYGAIGTGLTHILNKIKILDHSFEQTASFFARLGSGSASRSIEGPFVRWGRDQSNYGSNEFAQKVEDIHASFEGMQDCILLVDTNEKSVSSSLGHSLMNEHFYRSGRIAQAHCNFLEILNAMKSGDFLKFGAILESEALSLHGLMMSSNPSYMLLKANSVKIIEEVIRFRNESSVPLYFTIDAGPNIHLIYPNSSKQKVEEFIESELKTFCYNGQYILDQAGSGVTVHE